MKFLMVGFALFLHLNSFADSSCWPEEELIGTTATGFISGINFGEFETSDSKPPKKCETSAYAEPADNKGRILACDQIRCFRGDCSSNAEHTFLPVEESKGSLIRVSLKSGAKTWLKFKEQPAITEILPEGRIGKLFPEKTAVLDAPNGKPLKIKSAKPIAYTFKKMVKQKNQEWAQVEINPLISEEPEVAVGKSLGLGYFLHRNTDGKVAAVLSDVWCD